MSYDPRIEAKAHHICHMVGVNEGITLGDKSRSDVFLTIRALADYWKKELDEIQKDNPAKKWNELRIWLKRFPEADFEEIQKAMEMLDRGEYVRDYKPYEPI